MLPAHAFRLLFLHSSAGGVLMSPQLRILEVNEAFLDACGRTRAELVGLHVFEAFPDNEPDNPESGAKALERSLQRVITTGQRDVLAIQRYPIPVRLPDGQHSFEERLWSVINTPVHDEAGALLCIAHTTVDVTSLRSLVGTADVDGRERLGMMQAELISRARVLQEINAALQSERARHAFQLALADSLRELDAPQEIVATAGKLLGQELNVAGVLYAEHEEATQTWFVRSHWTNPEHPVPSLEGERHKALFGSHVLAALRAGGVLRLEDMRARPDAATAEHDTAWARLQMGASMTLALVKSGRLTGVLSVHHTAPRPWSDDDVENCRETAERTWAALEKARAQAELLDANRRKDEFLAMLAHELRNPLAPISAAAQMIELGRLDPARLKQTAQVISRQVKHMTSLVDDLLDVSRVTRGQVTLERVPQDLRDIVANAAEQVRPLIEAQRHRLTVELPTEPAHVLGDSKRLVQILTNLLNNAAKYTPPGGHLSLRVTLSQEHVELQVCDDGIGIAPQLQLRVFELFVQAERTSDRSQGGLGLGLALVKSLVELHGGDVGCQSEGVGLGACFTVRLPRQPEAPAERRQRQRGVAPAHARLKVLVVDDNEDAAETLSMLLETSGHEVMVEHGGLSALMSARLNAPDVCLLDIGLPDMDGKDLARQLRAQPETAGSVLIAITGYGQEQDRRNALEAGFDHHLVKPVDPAHLTALLNEIGVTT